MVSRPLCCAERPLRQQTMGVFLRPCSTWGRKTEGREPQLISDVKKKCCPFHYDLITQKQPLRVGCGGSGSSRGDSKR